MGAARRRKLAGHRAARHPDLPADFIKVLVEMANATDALMDGTTRPVLKLVAENDLVFGVWQDSTAPNGVGLLIVKGANRLREIIATGVNRESSTTAITCSCAEQAEALRLHAGADRTH